LQLWLRQAQGSSRSVNRIRTGNRILRTPASIGESLTHAKQHAILSNQQSLAYGIGD
jgi:hypothetical protein